LLGLQNIPQEFQIQILTKAAGIPFYIEEILRMLIDKRILVNVDGQWVFAPGEEGELDVPNNLQDLILTRFDRLDPVQRGVLQTASVLGRQFNASLLEEIMQFGEDNPLDRVMSSLVDKAFISPIPDFGEDGYLFRHVLTSDAVYGTLLRKDRKRLHGIVASTLEQVHAERLENQVEVLAGHFLRSEYLDKALHYLILAGNKSARDYANSQARKHFEEAKKLLPLVPHTTEQALGLWSGLGDVLVFIGEYEDARQCFQEALEMYKQDLSYGDDHNQSAIYRNIAITFERQGNFDLALDQLSAADDILKAAQISSPVPKAQILNDIGWIYFLRGNFDQAQDVLGSALNLVADSDQYSVVASIHNRLGAVAYQVREYDQAAMHVRRSLELRKTLGDLSGEARLYNNLGLLGLMSGDLREAEINFIQSIELLEKIGDTEGISLANINLGLVKFERGDYELAEMHLDKAKTIAEQIGHRFYLGLADMYLGRLETARGRYEQSVEMLEESMQIFEELGAKDNLIDAMCYLAENHLAWGDIDGSIHWSDKAHQELAAENGDLSDDSVQFGRVLRLQGTIARHQGEYARSEKLLLESAKIFSAAYEKLESARTAYELGLLALIQTKYDEAQQYFIEARTIFDEVGADKELLRLDFAMSQITV
jgi:adenylate cyclase